MNDDALALVTIDSPEAIRPAAESMRDLARARGLRVAACSDISSKEPMVDADGAILAAEVFGWLADGERWWSDTRLALSSPLPRACRYEGEPFWANAQGFHTCWTNPYLDKLDLTAFERRSLCAAAIVVPVHLPFGQIGAVSFPLIDASKTDLSAEFAEHSGFLGQIARRFVAGYANVMRGRTALPTDCKLSKHEVECLRWAAVGKTDREISMILSRSHATVRYHVQRAGEKLDAVNRSQTIFKAAQLGYLGASNLAPRSPAPRPAQPVARLAQTAQRLGPVPVAGGGAHHVEQAARTAGRL